MCIYVLLDCSPAHVKKARYAFEVLFDTLGFPYAFVNSGERDKITPGILVVYGTSTDWKKNSQGKTETIIISENWTESTDSIQVGFPVTPDGRKLPVLGKKGVELPQEVVHSAHGPVVVNADLIFSSFFFLSRREETETGTFDKHGRFPTPESIPFKHGFSQRAVVNEYLKLLLEIICQVARSKNIPLIRRCFWPNAEKLAVCLTHDVDIIKKWYLYSMVRCLELIRSGRLSSLLKTFWSLSKGLFSGKNPALAFEQITSAEENFSFKSSFYFMTGRPGVKSVLSSDLTYDLASPEILDRAKELLSKGLEVGLHASYHTFLNSRLLWEEKEELRRLVGSPVRGIRQHFLRLRIPQSWIDHQDCHFSYDTSLGFADQSGYRASFAFPFDVYDLQNDRKLDLLELPLAVMDRTYSKYLSFSPKQIKEDIISRFQELEGLGGMVTILWHTHMVDELGFSGYPRLYEEILDFVHQKGYFVAPGSQLAEWWRKRKSLELKCRSAGDKESSWELAASDSLDKISLELIGAKAGKTSVDGCNFDMVTEGDNTLVKLDGIRKGAKITLGIKTA
ncbi:MAG: hypothetical protein GTO24_19260 [candidate division Zixibacteria bacterium]|nr:hypothetical protein [candidate division Zixibacteria bacterium]